MRKISIAACFAIVCATSLITVSAAASKPTIVKPSDLTWNPLAGLAGAQTAVVYGNPNTAGTYTLRLKLANGTKVPPHWHPNDERVTVLSGTFLVGLGDKMDSAKMMALPAGTFIYIPARVRHYAMAKGDVLLQSTGMGPFKMNPVK